jgi:hypothetical protein
MSCQSRSQTQAPSVLSNASCYSEDKSHSKPQLPLRLYTRVMSQNSTVRGTIKHPSSATGSYYSLVNEVRLPQDIDYRLSNIDHHTHPPDDGIGYRRWNYPKHNTKHSVGRNAHMHAHTHRLFCSVLFIREERREREVSLL